MSYSLGVDLGTTFTSAAVLRGGRASTVPLGNHGASIPSVVFLQSDGAVLTGEVAARRGVIEPERLGREFKRRLGDTQQIFLGGAPYSAEQLSARLLRAVVNEVRTREGGDPDQIAVTHPANWGPYKTDLLRQAVQMAEMPSSTMLLAEPEAAAMFYAEDERLEPGQVIAVYDLGGGTFDSAVLRKTEAGFELLGESIGIERFGGIDLDAAVFAHVVGSLGDVADTLDPDDTDVTIALSRLKQECTVARESLSADTSVTIPVLLPGVSSSVRLTRAEVESMARPGLNETVNALRSALSSADLQASQLDAVLLVGGCTRMPLVSQLLGAELGRPVALSSDPTHAVALGAAYAAGSASESASATVSRSGAAEVPIATDSAMPSADRPSIPVADLPPTASRGATRPAPPVAPVAAPATAAPAPPVAPAPAPPDPPVVAAAPAPPVVAPAPAPPAPPVVPAAAAPPVVAPAPAPPAPPVVAAAPAPPVAAAAPAPLDPPPAPPAPPARTEILRTDPKASASTDQLTGADAPPAPPTPRSPRAHTEILQVDTPKSKKSKGEKPPKQAKTPKTAKAPKPAKQPKAAKPPKQSRRAAKTAAAQQAVAQQVPPQQGRYPYGAPEQHIVQPQMQQAAYYQSVPPAHYAPPPKKRRWLWLVYLLLFALFVAAGAAAMTYWQDRANTTDAAMLLRQVSTAWAALGLIY